MELLELHDMDGNLVGLYPPQQGACQNEGCENFDYPIQVPDHPLVTLQCGCCGRWIIPPSTSEPAPE